MKGSICKCRQYSHNNCEVPTRHITACDAFIQQANQCVYLQTCVAAQLASQSLQQRCFAGTRWSQQERQTALQAHYHAPSLVLVPVCHICLQLGQSLQTPVVCIACLHSLFIQGVGIQQHANSVAFCACKDCTTMTDTEAAMLARETFWQLTSASWLFRLLNWILLLFMMMTSWMRSAWHLYSQCTPMAISKIRHCATGTTYFFAGSITSLTGS